MNLNKFEYTITIALKQTEINTYKTRMDFSFFLTFNAISCLLAVNGGEQVYKNRHPTQMAGLVSGESKSKS